MSSSERRNRRRLAKRSPSQGAPAQWHRTMEVARDMVDEVEIVEREGDPAVEEEVTPEEKQGIDKAFGVLASHPAAQAEGHEGAAYLNMQAAALQNKKTGRHFLVSFPPDLTDSEMLEVIGWLFGPFRRNLELGRQQHGNAQQPQAPASLELVRGMPAGMQPPPRKPD